WIAGVSPAVGATCSFLKAAGLTGCGTHPIQQASNPAGIQSNEAQRIKLSHLPDSLLTCLPLELTRALESTRVEGESKSSSGKGRAGGDSLACAFRAGKPKKIHEQDFSQSSSFFNQYRSNK
ncbi:MAG: hypothetical protein M0Q18_08085, partial [Candidatus Cloacimonetes bacterium]|nr:hypothetical protein [Candidatus Cloacimonadota bacterium]